MAQISQTQLEILVQAVDKASSVLKGIGDQTKDLQNKTDEFGKSMKAAFAVVATYAGTQGLGFLINSIEDANKQLAQARFFLAGYGKDVDANFKTLVQWSQGVQQAIGVGDEYATLVASKLLPRVQSLSKAQEYASILLRGERIGILNANDAANMLIRATEGNERALRFLVEQMGISAPEFVSLQTLFEELRRRIEEGEKAMDPFSRAWSVLKENFGNFAETAGTPIVAVLGTILGWVNSLIERWPILGNIIAGVLTALALLFLAAGAIAAAQFVAPLLGGIAALGAAIVPFLLNPWTLAIIALIALALLIYFNWNTIVNFISAAWEVLKGVWNAVIDYVSDKMLAAWTFLTDKWKEFGDFWKTLWDGAKDVFQSAWQFISDKVAGIIDMVNRAMSAISSVGAAVGGGIKSAVSSVVSTVSGKRADGGSVDAGKAYLVGERGAELFMPGVSGSIIPNGAGGSIMIDMRGSTFLDRMAAVDIGDEIIKRLKELHRIGY